MGPSVYAIATMDTKGRELLYTADRLRSAGVSVVTIDVGTRNDPQSVADVSCQTVASYRHEDETGANLDHEERGAAISSLSGALTKFLVAEHKAGKVAGVIGLGGSGGTALITPAMRTALPIGLPKLMVSTVASGDTSPYVGCTDVCMMYSVVDVAGLNTVLRTVLANAAHAMAGMVKDAVAIEVERPSLGLTMFGLTTPCVTEAREELEPLGYDCLVFHATGTGGRAMEQLVASGLIAALLDVTTTEVADFLVGGVFPCTPDRFDAQIAARIPCVLSLGALDMVNFGARSTVPEKFRDRLFHQHNEQVTLMRTTVDENRRFGRWIAEKLNRWQSPVSLLIPDRGLSGLDAAGKPFCDPEADSALFNELEARVQQTSDRTIRRFPLHINDPQFARQLVRTFLELVALSRDPK